LFAAAQEDIFTGWRARGAMPRRVAAYLPAMAWAGLIALAAGATHVPGAPAVPHVDKVLHFGAYFVLGALLAVGWQWAGRRPARGWLLLLTLALGASDEVRQSRMEERNGEVADWVADAAGATAGLFLTARLLRRRRMNHGDDD
jgi:VanZ family protein